MNTETTIRQQARRRAFTLIEMALVTVIIGIMAYGVMSVMQDYMTREKLEESRRDAENAGQQIEGYLIGNSGKLPAPRTGNLMPTEIANNKDPWGNDLRYWRADELDGVAVDSVTSTSMYIRYYKDYDQMLTAPGGPDPNANSTISDVAYAVVSHGKNGVQDFSVATGSIYLNLMEEGYEKPDASSEREFDDVVDYATVSQVRTTFAASGLSGASQVASPDSGGTAPAMSIKGGSSGIGDLLSNTDYVAAGADVGVVSNTGVGSGQALSFGGATGAGEVQNRIDLTDDTNDYAFAHFTIMCWFKTDEDYNPDSPEAFGTFTERSLSSGTRNWWLTIWGGGYEQHRTSRPSIETENGDLAFKANGENWFLFTHDDPRVSYDDEQWHFVAITVRKYDPASPGNPVTPGSSYYGELYVDGEVKDTQVYSTAPLHGLNYEFYIGSSWNSYSTNRRYEGLIDEFYIFGNTDDAVDDSLTLDQIDAYYQAVKASYGH